MHFAKQSRFIIGLMATSSMAAFAVPAFAQEADSGSGLDEIVVTAQKREQNLQDVPIAISAISAEKVERLGIRDARDLSGLAPNVTITQGTTSAGAAVISMRGITSPASETFGLDQANALYVDGVYIGRSGASALDVMDIERVEVLRGPQGTLFGRNSTGGAIAFIGRKPSKELRVRAEAGYGNHSAWNGKIAVDPGEIMGVATSFSYSHRQRDGFVDNILESRDSRDPGAFKGDSFRAAARMELGDTGSFQYIFDWTKNRVANPHFQLTNVANGAPRSLSVNGKPLVVTQQAPVSQYLAAATFAQAACRPLAVPTREYRKEVCNDISSFSVDKTWGHNVQVENDFEAFKVKMTSGYRQWRAHSESDLDGIGAFSGPAFSNGSLFNGMPVGLLQFIPTIPAAFRTTIAAAPVPRVTQNLFDTSNRRKHSQFSNELEISGDTDNLDWVTGVFYFWEKGSENNPQNSGFVLDTNSIFTANFGPLGPSFVAANPARYRLVQTRAILKYTAQSESTAVYAQATVYPGGRDSGLRITAGGRYTWDSKKMFRTQNGAAPLAVPELGDASFSKFTWNLMLGYDIADGISAYARAATGYRSGGFNAQDAVLAGTNRLPSFGEESVTSYEVGLKTELLDRRLRLNLAAYHNTYDDLAVTVPLTNAPPGTFASVVDNAGKVKYTGFEAEMQAVLTDNFTIDGSIGYVDINYKTFMSGQSTTAGAPPINIASIVTPGYTSPWTGNIAANARFPIGSGDMQLTARVGYTYEDGKYSFNSIIGSPFNEALKGDNRNLVDAQIALENIAIGGAKADVRLWGKNLTNSHDFVRAVDFGALGFGGGYYGDPRTYGLTVGFKY
ncbi:MAG: hypothetical protein RIQ46_239 [Pseudomonadota bacterium]